MSEKFNGSKTCLFDGCGRKHFGLGYCSGHYQQLRQNRPLTPLRPNRKNGETAIRNSDGYKFCIYCETWKPESRFSSHGATVDRLQSYCMDCVSVRNQARQYSVDPNWATEQVAALNGVCPICKRLTERWSIDHDHSCCPGRNSCGKCVRGVICQLCNMGLGSFADDIPALESAILYLKGELSAND